MLAIDSFLSFPYSLSICDLNSKPRKESNYGRIYRNDQYSNPNSIKYSYFFVFLWCRGKEGEWEREGGERPTKPSQKQLFLWAKFVTANSSTLTTTITYHFHEFLTLLKRVIQLYSINKNKKKRSVRKREKYNWIKMSSRGWPSRQTRKWKK